ncbi:MAG: hypothetical protein RSD64_01585, partial [Christensenellaceae bacterium]
RNQKSPFAKMISFSVHFSFYRLSCKSFNLESICRTKKEPAMQVLNYLKIILFLPFALQPQLCRCNIRN